MILYVVVWHVMKLLKQVIIWKELKAYVTPGLQNSVLSANTPSAQPATTKRVTLIDVTVLG